jgi:hypothetical protein
MDYLKGISPKAIAIGFVGGYCVPYVLLKGLGYVLYSLGVSQLFGLIPLVIVALLTVLAPIASGYLGAKYSITLPLLNGMLATAIGVAAFFAVGQMGGAIIYAIVAVLAFVFGYVGAKRYVAYG